MAFQWDDSSGNGNHATQADDNKAPSVVAGVLNGYEVRRFDGTDDFLDLNNSGAPLFSATGGWTVFYVGSFDSGASEEIVLSQFISFGGNGRVLFRYDSAQPGSTMFLGNQGAHPTSSVVAGAPGTAAHLSSFRRSGAGYATWMNGTAGATRTDADATRSHLQTGNLIGARTANTSGAYNTNLAAFLDGDLAEIIVFQSALSTADRQGVETYLGAKYGLTLSHSATSVDPATLSPELWLRPAAIPKTGTDSGTGTDASSKEVTQHKSGTDAGTGTDTSSLYKDVSKSVTDSGTGTDTAAKEVIGAGGEVFQADAFQNDAFQTLVPVEKSGSDSGTGTDAASLLQSAVLEASDSGSGTDSSSLVKEKSVTDSGTGTDTASLVIPPYEYITPQETEAHMSASLREPTPSTPDPQTQFVRVDGSANEVIALLGVEHGIEAGKGTEVVHAEVILTLAEDMPVGTHILTVKPIDAEWDSSTVTYTTRPTVRATSGTESISGLVAGDEVTIDITTILSETVSLEGTTGQQWFGLELTTDGADELVFHGAYSTQYRPRIVKEVSRPPVAPFNLRPSDGLHVSELKPWFGWDFRDLDAEDTLSMIRFQLDTTDDFETPLYDSGWVASTSSIFDSNSPPAGSAAFSNLTAGNSYFWRAAQADDHGLESEFSTPQEITVTLKGTFTPAATPQVPTPTVSWTLTGVTQAGYYVAFERYEGGTWVTHWEQPWTTGTVVSVTLPDEAALQEGVSYRRTVRVTDTIDRASLPGDEAWYSSVEEFSVADVVMA